MRTDTAKRRSVTSQVDWREVARAAKGAVPFLGEDVGER